MNPYLPPPLPTTNHLYPYLPLPTPTSTCLWTISSRPIITCPLDLIIFSCQIPSELRSSWTYFCIWNYHNPDVQLTKILSPMMMILWRPPERKFLISMTWFTFSHQQFATLSFWIDICVLLSNACIIIVFFIVVQTSLRNGYSTSIYWLPLQKHCINHQTKGMSLLFTCPQLTEESSLAAAARMWLHTAHVM